MATFTGYPSSNKKYPDENDRPRVEGDSHRDASNYAVKALEIYFQNQEDAYVSGNLFIYYEEDNPEAFVVPDVFLVFGVPKGNRILYKVWEENDQTPDFVLEITSRKTLSVDRGAKTGIYAFLGVIEYFQYDPQGDYLQPKLQGYRLVAGNYLPIPSMSLPDGTISLRSEVMGLDIRLESDQLRFYDPIEGKNLLTHEESEEARKQAEEQAIKELTAKKMALARVAELETRLRLLQKKQQTLKEM